MDYSAAIETEAGHSPWGSASPRAQRTPYAGATPDSPTTQSRHAISDSQSSLPEPAIPASQIPTSDDPVEQPRVGTLPEIPSPEVISQQSTTFQAPPETPTQSQQQQPPPPQSAQQRPGAARYHSARQQRPVPQYKLQAKVTALERTGRKDPVLRFDVYTNLPKFRTTQFRDVRRTHSEFVKLAEHLISSNPEAMVPAVPPALTSAGAGTDEDEVRVKTSIQRWLNYVCSNDVLIRDEEMVFFVESDFGYSPVVRMKQPATGVRRKVLKQFAPPPDDTPELHYARPVVKAFYLGSLDAAQRLDKVVKGRRGLGLAETSLGEKIATMHVQETHPGLSHAYRKLGRIIQTCGDYHAAQATAEATTLGDSLNYHSADAFIVKETLTNRHILLRELVQAEATRKSKETSVNRLKMSSNIKRDKVEDAITQLDEAAQAESFLRSKTQRVTGNLLIEKRKWFDRTSNDLLDSIREYVHRQIDAERRMLAMLESVRPDIRSIDASGGLSRLGRENNPNIRRISMASSQTVKGDAWSGVARSRDTLSRSMSGSFTSGVPENDEVGGNGTAATEGNRPRSGTAGSLKSVKEDEDNDRVDARNAASRLAQSTF